MPPKQKPAKKSADPEDGPGRPQEPVVPDTPRRSNRTTRNQTPRYKLTASRTAKPKANAPPKARQAGEKKKMMMMQGAEKEKEKEEDTDKENEYEDKTEVVVEHLATRMSALNIHSTTQGKGARAAKKKQKNNNPVQATRANVVQCEDSDTDATDLELYPVGVVFKKPVARLTAEEPAKKDESRGRDAGEEEQAPQTEMRDLAREFVGRWETALNMMAEDEVETWAHEVGRYKDASAGKPMPVLDRMRDVIAGFETLIQRWDLFLATWERERQDRV